MYIFDSSLVFMICRSRSPRSVVMRSSIASMRPLSCMFIFRLRYARLSAVAESRPRCSVCFFMTSRLREWSCADVTDWVLSSFFLKISRNPFFFFFLDSFALSYAIAGTRSASSSLSSICRSKSFEILRRRFSFSVIRTLRLSILSPE